MKRGWIVALCVLLAVAPAGCASRGGESAAPPVQADPPAAAEPEAPAPPAIPEATERPDEPEEAPEPVDYARLLAENDNFAREEYTELHYVDERADPTLQILNEQYGLEAVAGEGDTFSRAVNLLDWLCAHTYHNGWYDNHVAQNAMDLLEYAFDTGEENGINCMNLAIVLTEALLSQGIEARTLWIMPGVPEDFDNHVVTIAFLPELAKWVLLDPTHNAYFTDPEGVPLSPLELREALARGDSPAINPGAHYNGEAKDDEEVAWYLLYLAKNLYYLFCFESQLGPTGLGDRVYLAPGSLDVTEWLVANLYYRDSQSDEPMTGEQLREDEAWYRSIPVRYASPADFWGRAES